MTLESAIRGSIKAIRQAKSASTFRVDALLEAKKDSQDAQDSQTLQDPHDSQECHDLD